ncbi:MAG: sugar phosphate nucleotidyltransferase [Myxococcota bacterium]|nr:sugar phosphate nucleotidyltransferase [Myxococcota bacterium]
MDVVILAGGKGTRLAELTQETPKGLAPIGDRPILSHLMGIFARQGHRRFILCVGYEGHQIADYFGGEGRLPGTDVIISDSGLAASKSQRIADALVHVKSDRFLLSYGDDLANIDLSAVIAQGERTESIVTLTAVQPLSPFGVLNLETNGLITGFREKCRMPDWINGGFMSVSRQIEGYLALGELENEVFERLVVEHRLNAYRHQGFWKAMNTHKDYLQFNELTDRGELPWENI